MFSEKIRKKNFISSGFGVYYPVDGALEMSEESTEDKNYQRFMSFLRNSKNVSEHTVASYGIDICQFARLALGKDPLKEQIDWNLVTVEDARSFIVEHASWRLLVRTGYRCRQGAVHRWKRCRFR